MRGFWNEFESHGFLLQYKSTKSLVVLYLPWTACNFFSFFKQDFKAKTTSTGKESADYKCNDFQTCLLEVAKKYGVLL